MNIVSIDVSERDTEIRVRHDLIGSLGSVTLDKHGITVGEKRFPWERFPLSLSVPSDLVPPIKSLK